MQPELAAIHAHQLQPELSSGEAGCPINLRTKKGHVVCLLGMNTQLLDIYLRTLAGVHAISAGTLALYGQNVATIPELEWPLLRQKISYISKATPLLSVASGFNNLIMPSQYHNKDEKPALIKKAQQLLMDIDFQGNSEALPAYLSPLERVQLSIIRAVMLDPEVLILDDPWYALDPFEYSILNQFFVTWAKAGTLITATSNVSFVRKHAQQIYFVGKTEVHFFSSWYEFCASTHSEVKEYLALFHE